MTVAIMLIGSIGGFLNFYGLGARAVSPQVGEGRHTNNVHRPPCPLRLNPALPSAFADGRPLKQMPGQRPGSFEEPLALMQIGEALDELSPHIGGTQVKLPPGFPGVR